MESIHSLDEAKAVLDQAASMVASTSRLTRKERMAILAKVYSIRLQPEDHEQMIAYICHSRKLEGANRAYVMQKSNGYTLPLRYVFPSITDRSSVSRWAGALNELCRQGVPPAKFADAVQKNGGITELYWQSRDRENKRSVRQRILLDRQIDIVTGKTYTLTLRPDQRGVFEVLDFKLHSENFLEAAE